MDIFWQARCRTSFTILFDFPLAAIFWRRGEKAGRREVLMDTYYSSYFNVRFVFVFLVVVVVVVGF